MNHFVLFVAAAVAASCSSAYAGDCREECGELIKVAFEAAKKFQEEVLPGCAMDMLSKMNWKMNSVEDFQKNWDTFHEEISPKERHDCVKEGREKVKGERKAFEGMGKAAVKLLTENCIGAIREIFMKGFEGVAEEAYEECMVE